jgi:CRISPR/Cas system CSM-associated protein Csm3 (group 7 of RAMP superfamily)
MPFKDRWQIVGTLTTLTPLHIGNGESTQRKTLIVESSTGDSKEKVQIAAVATDGQGQAYIPGTTLKGDLRAWLKRHHSASATVKEVFGSEDAGADDAVGGKAEFWDARVVACPDPAPPVPYWHPQRLTGVAAAVAIDRRTHTASPNKLLHQEFVPPGVAFEVTITGQDMQPDELHLLLYALEQFNSTHAPVSLGANTGDGQGRLTWTLIDIACLSKADVIAWLQRQDAPVGYAGYHSLAAAEREALVAQASRAFAPAIQPAITLHLALHCAGPFLINDPSQTIKDKDAAPDTHTPDHIPLRDAQGRVLLPARSIRGVMRSQAEKIVRTLNVEAACRSTDPADACNPIYEAQHSTTYLCLTCQMFGATGWRAPVAFSDFVLLSDSPETPFQQEFVAIDRFTGGGADRLKFNAQAVYQPVLSGILRLDLQRLDPWALGLLALSLRDAMEGDLTFGFGASKGYGAGRITVTGICATGLDGCAPLWELFESYEATQIDCNSLDTTTRPPLELELVVMECVRLFQHKVQTFTRRTPPGGDEDAVS